MKMANRHLILPYALPYFAYVGIASLSQDRIMDHEKKSHLTG